MAVEYIWVQGENGATMMMRPPQPDPKGLFGEEGMSFKDALDIINPLQQLPIIGSIYRAITGDTISPGARLIGGAIYGLGVGGIVAAALNCAVEETTGHDLGGTALAMIQGESLTDMQAAQAAKNSKSPTQLASAQFYRGGADPIDPTSLPAGAQLVDLPAGSAAATATQYAALPNATAPNADPSGVPAPSPAAAVSVAPLPPTINPTAGAAPGDGASVPALPNTSTGMTGLSAGSHLPTAGSITPASAALTAASVQQTLQAGAGAGAGTSATAATALGAATASQPVGTAAASPLAQSGKSADGFFPVPARTNNVTPRMPIALTPANVGIQPLALSNGDRRSLDKITVSAPAPITTVAPTPAPTAEAPTASALAATPMVAPAQVPEAMMRALDKYDALMRSRRNGGQVDRNL